MTGADSPVIADSSTSGVVDSRHRVFNYKNMYICDGSVVAANLGVNPSLTITALAERAMSFIPAAAEPDWSDAASVCDQAVDNGGLEADGSNRFNMVSSARSKRRAI